VNLPVSCARANVLLGVALAFSCVMQRRSRFDMREDDTPEPEDLPDLETKRAFA